MLWIVEGCDGVGKTTLVERIGSFGHDIEVMHRGPLRGPAIVEYEADLEEYWPGCGRHVICDRWHIGELVYGPLLRGESGMRVSELRHIEKFLQRRGAMIIHVTAPADVVQTRLESRGDDLVAPHMVTNILDAYYDLLPRVQLPVTTFDGTQECDMANAYALLHAAAVLETVCVPIDTFLTYVGPPNPSILLLGERRKNTDGRSAFVPAAATSGDYLLSNLPDDVHVSCGVANACEEDIVALYEALGMPMVVALGRDAAAECRRAELPFGEVPHPQYVRRFHHNRGAEYGRAIREAALFTKDMTQCLQ